MGAFALLACNRLVDPFGNRGGENPVFHFACHLHFKHPHKKGLAVKVMAKGFEAEVVLADFAHCGKEELAQQEAAFGLQTVEQSRLRLDLVHLHKCLHSDVRIIVRIEGRKHDTETRVRAFDAGDCRRNSHEQRIIPTLRLVQFLVGNIRGDSSGEAGVTRLFVMLVLHSSLLKKKSAT